MEWVETTAKSIEDAKDFVLDQLGVDEDEAEIEILEEPTTGLFGRQRGQARVRARIMPKSPRGKEERRRRSPRGKSASGSGRNGDTAAAAGSEAAPAPAPKPKAQRAPSADRPQSDRQPKERVAMDPEPFIAPLTTFLEGVVTSAGLTGAVAVTVNDEGDLAASITGDHLGALIGPAGGVVDALQELSRTFLQKEAQGGSAPRLKVDVGNYRADRKIALEAFVNEIAEQVRATGTPHAFEYMGSVDRKTIHDAATELEGIESSSEGEDPDRYVVLSPG